VLADATVPVLVVRPTEIAAGEASCFRTILVAFDATHAESLPLASEIARACAARLHLLMVIPTYETRRGGMRLIGRYLPGATMEALDLETEGARLHLAERRKELEASGLEVTADVVRGSPVPAILEAASSLKPDLTVMATHGHRGLGAFWTGSVASDVCARCERPVLLVPASG
jgi:nucleotide-binding universal stress UspA family protein